MQDFFAQVSNTLFGIFNMFSGGGCGEFLHFALGIMPYISASIIIQLLTVVSPDSAPGQGRRRGGPQEDHAVHALRHVLITVVQGLFIAIGLETCKAPRARPWCWRRLGLPADDHHHLTAGTVLVMWLGEQMTERGIGNGISLIIFGGIVAGLPAGSATPSSSWALAS